MKITLALVIALGFASHAVGQNDLTRAMPRTAAAHWPNSVRQEAPRRLYYTPVHGQRQQIPATTPWRYNAQHGPAHSLVRPAWEKSQRGAAQTLRTTNSSLPYLNIVPGPYYFQPAYTRMP